ncbi:hypothetical protein KI387_007108, partial [Taxus chinensis]
MCRISIHFWLFRLSTSLASLWPGLSQWDKFSFSAEPAGLHPRGLDVIFAPGPSGTNFRVLLSHLSQTVSSHFGRSGHGSCTSRTFGPTVPGCL